MIICFWVTGMLAEYTSEVHGRLN